MKLIKIEKEKIIEILENELNKTETIKDKAIIISLLSKIKRD